jgi:hypothetical protein
VAEFGPLSPDPVIQHASRAGGIRNYDAAEVLAMAFRLGTGDALAARAPSPSAESMEHLILATLAARPGGDLVYRRNQESRKLFCLAPGIHDMHAVARELAERSHINAKWMGRFHRAWRALCDSGALDAPSLIPIAEAFPACRRRVRNLGEGAYIDGGRNRFYVRLTGRSASAPPPAAVCRKCGVDLMTTHGLAKWCTACKAKLIRAERSKRLRILLAGAKCECCGKNFTAVRSNQLFCSSTCKQMAYRERKARAPSSGGP